MLGMGFFKSLIKEHAKTYFEPIGRTLQELGVRQPKPLNPMHAWALRKPLWNYSKWWIGESLSRSAHPALTAMPEGLAAHARFAIDGLQRSRMEVSAAMRTHQLRLADRQCRMSELSQRIQDLTVILTASLWASDQDNEVVQAAAEILCQDLTRKLTGGRPSDRYFRAVTKLGETIETGAFAAIAGIEPEEILMRY
jgi:hypothetical protein